MITNVEKWKRNILCCFYSSLLIVLRGAASFSQFSDGLNRWSFAKNTGQHELYSDLLCPNPLFSWVDEQNIHGGLESNSVSQNAAFQTKNDVWTFKSPELMTLPCELGNNSVRSSTRTDKYLQKILFVNVTYEPFDFGGARECTRFIKLNYDELEGAELNCDDDNTDVESVSYREKSYIYWPEYIPKRTKYFSIYQNLENLLRHEEKLKTRFFFQIYFYSANGSTETCRVQQYELDFLRPEGCTQLYRKSSSGQPRLNRKFLPCGEYSCSHLIFPLYNIKPVKILVDDGSKIIPVVSLDPVFSHNSNRTSYTGRLRLDVRSIIFVTILPILLFGALVFGMQLFIYTTCSRSSRTASNTTANRGRDATRSQQILQNSLNLWETLPAREPRSVSFSPVTTNIDAQLVNSNQPDVSVPELPETPKILKSALKRKSNNDFFPPPPPQDSDSSLYD